MSFTTIDFIVFFASIFFGYYALPSYCRWWLLLTGSVVFYGWLSPYYLIFLGVTIVVSYIAANWMDRSHGMEKIWLETNSKIVSREEKKSYKAAMERGRGHINFVAISLLLLMLVIFKYLEFLLANVSSLIGLFGFSWQSPTLNLILPIGLSFYLFQSIAYLIDVQRGEVPAERNFFRHALFLSYFPQIMQGPIGNYGRLSPQFFLDHPFNYQNVVFGSQRLAWGFFKKVMIANTIAVRINPVWTNVNDYPGFICWGTILFLYSVQLYADFSGYMDIACGCSQMLGIKLDENFNCPYYSRSVSEFWRRWHITLSTWFKNYLFYPILRSGWNTKLRKTFANKYLASTVPTLFALAIVWVTTGLWHGASWGYVAWGGYYGAFMILGIMLAPIHTSFHKQFPNLTHSRLYALFQMVRTFMIVMFGYAIFKPANLTSTGEILRQMFSAIDGGGVYKIQYTLHHSFIKVFVWIAFMFMVDVVHYTRPNGTIRMYLHRLPLLVRWSIYVAGLWLMIFFGEYGSGFEQFEYFKF